MDNKGRTTSRSYRLQRTTAVARLIVIVAVVGMVAAAPMVGGVGLASAQESSPPTIDIGDATVAAGNSTNVSVSMSEAPDGLAGYDIVLGVENNSTATITDAEINDEFALSEVNVSDNGTSMVVNLRAVDLEDNIGENATNISLADVEVEGKNVGETALEVQKVRRVDDDNGNEINVSSTSGRITVEPAGGPGDGNATANLGIVLDREHVTAGDETTGDVVLSKAPEGVAGFNITVSVNGEDVTIVAASAGDEFDLSVADNDADSAMIRGVDLNRNVEAGAENVTLATVYVRSAENADGTVTMNVSDVDVLENDDSGTIQASTSGATLEVHDVDPVVYGRLPTDPNDDGLYEDVDGDGDLTNNDVNVFFQKFNSGAIQNHDEYDFDGNGRLSYTDIIALSDSVAAAG